MLGYINNLLNRFSMYRVVSGLLTILALLTFVFSLTGTIVYSPLAIVASLTVLGVSCYITAVLLGLIFGIRIHGESSYITAFILFFIFAPTTQLAGLLVLGVIGIIAAASKFILVYHGRHIFNPAAAAAFIIGLTGLGFATWWVASPPLMPAMFIIGLTILYKTRRLLLGGIFIATATPLVVLVLLSYGSSLGESLALLLSWPILFFSGVMLSEPLTMPQKKWQQVVEALIVAVLFAIPIHIGDFASTPALALLVGNLVAFSFSRRRAISLQFKGSRELTPTSQEFTFTSSRNIPFEAGQYMEITVPHKKADMRGLRRSFSITSAPSDRDIQFGVKFYEPSSTFKQAMKSIPGGATVRATGISGGFTLPAESTKPLLFIAGGIGITPFISHLRHLKSVGQQRDIILFYAVANKDELAYIDILKEAGIKVFVVTKSDSDAALSDWVFIHEPYITEEILRDNIPDVRDRQVYISGPPLMIDGAKHHLKHLGIKQRNIKTDYFIGY